jgi:mevalonate kinase
LNRFATHLETLQIEQPNLVTFDLKNSKDVATGMYFDSSIPQGYGVAVVVP